MATATGTYATLAAVKTRLGIADSADDTLISSLCDQMNGWVESFTGRVLAPIPVPATTLNGAILAGATSFAVASATDIAIGDALLLGPVAGTHEHVIVAGISGTTIMPQAPLISDYPNGAAVSGVLVFDGLAAQEHGRMIPCARGLVTVTYVEVATYTGGAYLAVPMRDIFLGPLWRDPGWPATELWMSNVPSASNPAPAFYSGMQTVRCLGQAGWPVIPDEVADLAIAGVVTRYKTRAMGGTDNALIGVEGERTFIRNLSVDEKQTLKRYQLKEVVIV